MSLPNIDFSKIRLQNGSQNFAFEELCCQLASLEEHPEGAAFYRKGIGADAGVECFVRYQDGSETGWQAKFVFSLGKTQIQNLDESIKTALIKHPTLIKYIVCLPFDLRDARNPKAISELGRWEEWVKKWKKAALKDKRKLEIELWSKHIIGERLGRNDPLYSGRLFYWFNQESFSSEWFYQQFDKSREALGNRYSPEFNIELPIRRILDAFVRNPSLNKEIDNWNIGLQEAQYETINSLSNFTKKKPPKKLTIPLQQTVSAIIGEFSNTAVSTDKQFPLEYWRALLKAANKASRDCLEWVWNLPDEKKTTKEPIDRKNYAKSNLYKLCSLLDDIFDALGSERWIFSNHKQLLVHGQAGTGKSHLFADIAKYQVQNNRPALLVLGSMFADDGPWKQIFQSLDLPLHVRAKDFLGALDAAAQAAGTRAIILIDALNERNGVEVWPSRLASFLSDIKPFPRVAIALSCRSTYIDFVIPDSLPEEKLPRIEHIGFAGHAAAAAKIYLDKRGIVRPGAPQLVPEFENPLFLRTCCDALEKEGKKELPKGLRGITAIFNFYIDAIAKSLTKEMKLDPHQDIIRRAINELANACIVRKSGYIEKAQTIEVLENILPSAGTRDRSLLSRLESEGVLTIEPVRSEDGSKTEFVRFTFERFSDHAIISHILDQHLSTREPKKSFKKGTYLHDLITTETKFRQGLLEALAIQLPERTDLEIMDIAGSWSIESAFVASLLWRNQKCFTQHTLNLLSKIRTNETVLSILISLATEPDNRFNAHYLHQKLIALKLPERDQKWSAYVARRGEDGVIETLINWALENGCGTIEDARAKLAAIQLTWLFSTSNRVVRDTATKALACLLAKRLDLARELLVTFKNVDDYYILERLLASIYGSVLQGLTSDGLSNLAQTTYNLFFVSRKPIPHVLVRDYARGIIEYANWRGQISNKINLSRIRPPYKSPWPIEFVTEELIKTYTEDYGEGKRYTDRIVSSLGEMGDFSHYVVDHIVTHWSPVPIGTKKLPTGKEIYLNWLEGFQKKATKKQRAALAALLEKAKADSSPSWQETPERKAHNKAKKKFYSTLKPKERENYRMTAERFIREALSKERYGSRPACFDAPWAKRWICKRAHDLGWTPERFSEIEREMNISWDRNSHKIERIGKKYQWLALHELVARMADNLAYIEEDFEGKKYEGPWQHYIRDIDPSLLVTKTNYDGWKQWDKTWWVPVAPSLKSLSKEERLVWLKSKEDIINAPSLIEVQDPETNQKWLTLESFSHWRQHSLREGKNSMESETWFRLKCIVVRKKDEKILLEYLKNKILTDPHTFPGREIYSRRFLGEYSWHSAFEYMQDWERGGWRELPVPIRTTVTDYTCEKGNYDYSIEKTINVGLPAPWLIKELGLHLANGKELTYKNNTDKTLFFDPSVSLQGPQAALIDREAFLDLLKRKNLSPIWVIAGEKSVYGGKNLSLSFGGRAYHTYIYQLKGKGFSCEKYLTRDDPSQEQLAQYMKRD